MRWPANSYLARILYILVAQWALKEGIREKDVVALMMDNRPEFIITWLAMAKIGVLTALINTNLRGQVIKFI